MSRLEELIEQYCPDGVEYVRLGDVAQVCRGTRVVRSQLTEVGYPVYQNCLTPMGCFEDTNCPKGTTFVICGGAAGNVGYTDVDCWAADDCEYIECSHTILNRYVYYCLMSKQHYLLSKVRKASIPRLSPNVIKDLEIPVPPLPVQEEIVRILDAFTELQAELQAELQKRRQQYNYYLDNLLNFNRGGQTEVKWMKMSDIAKLSRGHVISKDYLQNNAGIYPVYSSQTANNGELGQINTYDYNGNYLTWTTDGAYAGTIFKREGCFSITNVCGLIALTSELVNLDYLYYWLKITAPSYVYKGMGNPKLMSNVMESILIPIIPLSEQQRIVSILDRFDTLTTDLTQGLPAEIEKRRQQYEYYRDKLLTFKRKEA